MKKIKEKIEDIFFFIYEYSLKLCIYITSHNKNKMVRAILFLLCMPYMLIRCLILNIYEHSIGKWIMTNVIKKDRKRKFKYELSIVATAKDEGKYIREWVAYYKAICEDKLHIYLYDNDSTDNMKEQVQDYIDEGLISYIPFPGKNKQFVIYNDAVKRVKEETRYMAVVDIDEFIVPTKEENLTDFLVRTIESKPNAAGVAINWMLYGSSGIKKMQPGLVIETFLKRSVEAHWGNTHVKTICNPRLVNNYISSHYPLYKSGCWNIAPNGKRQRLWWNKKVDWSIASIHHYFCKSEEEYMIKQRRGFAHQQGNYNFDWFIRYDTNDVQDEIMLRYTDRVKKCMESRI